MSDFLKDIKHASQKAGKGKVKLNPNKYELKKNKPLTWKQCKDGKVINTTLQRES